VSPQRGRNTRVVAALGALVLIALAGVLVVHVRHGAAGALAPAAAVASPSPSLSIATTPVNERQTRWLVAEAKATTVAYERPSSSAPVRATLPLLNAHRCVTVMLVRKTERIGGATWYDVWLPRRPDFGSGWVPASSVATYTTTAEIVVNLSARRLTIYRGGRVAGRFPVAIGSSTYPTPTGLFFVAEKTTPMPGSPFGVLALGLSGYQPRLPDLGALAIHGTNNDALIGQAVSEGCIRMHNADVLRVSRWVPAGSPVLIER
jgi:lipoprotein-anchoring transpeptidase ErfK/SrfK